MHDEFMFFSFLTVPVTAPVITMIEWNLIDAKEAARQAAVEIQMKSSVNE